MRWLESVLAWLSPTMLLNGTPWAQEWQLKQRNALINSSRIVVPLVAAAWILHYFLYDRPMGLEPLEHWFILRMSNAGLCILVFAFYLTPLPRRVGWYRAPAILVAASVCISQAIVARWYGQEAWVFAYVFLLAAVMFLRMSVLSSLVFAAVVLAVQWVLLVGGGVPQPYVISGTVVAVLMVVLLRSSYVVDVRNFLLSHRNIAAQQHITELNTELAERIRAFIPRVIAERLQQHIDVHGKSVLAASLEVLEPRKRDVACLFSDIRGFTRGSNELERFVGNSMMPEMKLCSDAVEHHMGIPRKVGDLLFAYFDDDYIRLNLLRAVAAGLEIARLNADMNATSADVEIRRYILISSGEAVVGNLGGLDSSVEITALGPPVNYLSRLDEVTKQPPLRNVIEPGDIILCDRSAALLEELKLDLELAPVDLGELELAIRDFPEARIVYILRPHERNYNNVMEPYNYIRAREEADNGAQANGREHRHAG